MKPDEVKNIIETMIFASNKPLSPGKIGSILEIEENIIRGLVQDIMEEYDSARAIGIREVAGGYEMYARPEYSKYIQALVLPPKPPALTGPALETLSIIAYKQPITRGEIEKIRGVNVDSVINTLLERELIEEAGRKDGVGRPILYKTTEEFLRYFGLKGLHELPEVYEMLNEEE